MTPHHQMSAFVQARQRGMGTRPGSFGSRGPEQDRNTPGTARDVLGATPGVRKAEHSADQNRQKGGSR